MTQGWRSAAQKQRRRCPTRLLPTAPTTVIPAPCRGYLAECSTQALTSPSNLVTPAPAHLSDPAHPRIRRPRLDLGPIRRSLAALRPESRPANGRRRQLGPSALRTTLGMGPRSSLGRRTGAREWRTAAESSASAALVEIAAASAAMTEKGARGKTGEVRRSVPSRPANGRWRQLGPPALRTALGMGPKSSLGRRKRGAGAAGGGKKQRRPLPHRHPRPHHRHTRALPRVSRRVRHPSPKPPRIRRPRLDLGPKRRSLAAQRTEPSCERSSAATRTPGAANSVGHRPQIKFGATDRRRRGGRRQEAALVPRMSRYPRRSAGMTERGARV